jgi:hypothetical protein
LLCQVLCPSLLEIIASFLFPFFRLWFERSLEAKYRGDQEEILATAEKDRLAEVEVWQSVVL